MLTGRFLFIAACLATLSGALCAQVEPPGPPALSHMIDPPQSTSLPTRPPLLLPLPPAASRPTAVPFIEDLSACKLPNYMLVLPLPESRSASTGVLIRLATGSFSQPPVIGPEGKVRSPDQVLETLRTNKTADLQYLPDAGGAFWAVSARILDLGYSYLADAAAKPYDAPMEIRGNSRMRAGLIPVDEGHVYLIQTSDDKFALLRVLEKTAEGCVVQYVYQPGGERTFVIPPTQRIPYRTPMNAMSAGLAGEPGAPGAGGGGSGAGGPLVLPPLDTTPPRLGAVAATNSAYPLVPPVNIPPAAPAAILPAAPALAGDPNPIAPWPDNTRPAAGASTTMVPPLNRPKQDPGDVYDPQSRVIRLTGHGGSGSSPAPAVTPIPAAAGPLPLDGDVDAVMRQRQAIIASRLSIVNNPARNINDAVRKAQAISDLAALHAEEAADLFVQQINFVDQAAQDISPENVLPCFNALKHLGKPATDAAIKGLRSLDPDAPGEYINSPMYKADLLAKVIRANEGDDIGNLLLQKELQREKEGDNPRRVAMYEYLLKKPEPR